VYCVLQVVNIQTIISNNPVYSYPNLFQVHLNTFLVEFISFRYIVLKTDKHIAVNHNKKTTNGM